MFLEEKKAGEVSKTLEPWRRLMFHAANVLEDHGWCQQFETNLRGQHCLLGALSRAAYDLREKDKTRYRAHRALIDKVGDVPTWNDVLGRTQEEACHLLRSVAGSE
jgi:uncharacterized protein (DUF924 family)